MTTPIASGRRVLAAFAVALLGTLVVLVVPALAQEAPEDSGEAPVEPSSPSFSVQPSGPDGPGDRDWFTYTLDPGTSFGDVVAISNLSDKPIHFFLYPTDAVSVADSAGFAAMKDTDKPEDVGTWIELAADEFTVEPGKRVDVPFSVTVPEDAEPGDHAGALLAVDTAETEAAGDPSDDDGISFDVVHRLGARIYVRVGGETSPDLRIDELSVIRDGDRATVSWEVLNTGNLRLTPSAEVRIKGWFGRTVATASVQQLPELLPDANFVGATVLDGMPSYEPLTAELIVRAEGVETKRSEQFAGYPWLLLLVIALLLAAGGWWWRRRRRREAGPPPSSRAERVPVPA